MVRGTIKDIAVIAVVSFAIPLVISILIALFVWWLFTGAFLETDADMLEMPKPPLVFTQYKRQGHYSGYLSDYDEEMEYNEYYYFKNVSFADYPEFQPVTQDNIPEIRSFVQNYEQHLDEIKERADEDADRLCRRYRYDPESLSSGDYYRVETWTWDEERTFPNYTLCIFDHEKNTLYYFKCREV